ncbi:hypothetical protein [Nocardia sp. CC201C]|uniref:hypothetical protein n=1 Tax=Nocardia sp. CC201C TaxID=3044575 RepID=UPI0024A89A31|nr:hypothetical protein [Nocardia sp. CC201C]
MELVPDAARGEVHLLGAQPDTARARGPQQHAIRVGDRGDESGVLGDAAQFGRHREDGLPQRGAGPAQAQLVAIGRRSDGAGQVHGPAHPLPGLRDLGA